MKKALFIDRDGTIIAEPADEQIDSLEKLAFVPGAISALKALTGLGFDLVLATNQDGLGTPSFPEDTFWPAHNKMLATLGGEGVAFDDQLIDRTFEADAAPTRKPRTGMFGRYTGGEYDLAASYVIGDRATDILLARNLGARGILLAPPAEGLRTLEEAGAADACALVTDSWSEIAEFIRRGERRAEIRRETRETQITVRLDLDGRGDFNGQISTGLRFLDHMLAQIAHHGGVALAVDARGDLDIDEHHTMEDMALIDQSKQQIYPHTIYAVGVNEEIYIKQIETLPGHRMLLRSLNERYEPIEVDLRGDMAESVRIIGKVIWWCREA